MCTKSSTIQVNLAVDNNFLSDQMFGLTWSPVPSARQLWVGGGWDSSWARCVQCKCKNFSSSKLIVPEDRGENIGCAVSY